MEEKEKIIEIIQAIGTETDESKRRESLTTLNDSITKVFDDIDSLNNTINEKEETIKKNNENIDKLREENMKWFLRSTDDSKTPEQRKEDSTGIKDPESNKKEKLKFEDLFK